MIKPSIALGCLLLASCGCPEFTTGPVQDPRVYNASITEFNSGWNAPLNPDDPGDLGTPVPLFSISSFEFPANSSSSGTMPNDPRFSRGRGITLANAGSFTAANGRTYSAQLVVRPPSNELIAGDVMVVSVDTVARTAQLRFFGQLYRMPRGLDSASATALVDYIRAEAHTDAQLSALRSNARPHGSGPLLPQRVDTVVVDEYGREVLGIEMPADVRARLRLPYTITARDVTVSIGEVYYYIARNGFEFMIQIVDIGSVPLAPHPRNVRIAFAALHGPTQCVAP